MHGAGTVSVLFVTMVPQTVVSMMSLTPPVMADDDVVATLRLPAGAAGFYTGLIYFFVLITNIVAAPLIAWFGPLRLSFACIVLAGFGLALFGSGSIVGVLFATTVIGLSYGPLTPASSQVLATQSQSQAFALLVSVRQTSVPLGGVLAGLLVPQLVLRLGWQSSCVALGLGTAVFAFVMALSLPIIHKEQPAGRTRFSGGLLGPLRFITQRRDLLTLSAASTIFGALQLVLSAFLVIYLVTVVGHGPGQCRSAPGAEPSLRRAGTYPLGLCGRPGRLPSQAAGAGRGGNDPGLPRNGVARLHGAELACDA